MVLLHLCWAKMTLEGAITVKEFLDEHERLSQGLSGGVKLGKGAVKIAVGTLAIIAPIPTPAEDIAGIRKITFGIYDACYGVALLVGILWR